MKKDMLAYASNLNIDDAEAGGGQPYNPNSGDVEKETLNNLLKVTRPVRSGAKLEPRLTSPRWLILNEHPGSQKIAST